MTDLVSIIIPVYNQEQYLEETLTSIENQTYLNWECIIIDDGSNDSSYAIATSFQKKDARFIVAYRDKNEPKGANTCRNIGFEKSKGSWVMWFDGDDIMLPTLIEKKCTSIALQESLDVVVSKLLYYHKGIPDRDYENVIYDEDLIERYLFGNVSFYVCGGLWKRDFLLKHEMIFDPLLSNLDDWDFNLRMLYSNPEIIFLNETLMKYRIHEDSLSHEIDKLNKEEVISENRARQKHVTILKQQNPKLASKLQTFVVSRNQFFFKKAMQSRHTHKLFFLTTLLQEKIKKGDLLGVLKTISGFCLYVVFNKGYNYLQ